MPHAPFVGAGVIAVVGPGDGALVGATVGAGVGAVVDKEAPGEGVAEVNGDTGAPISKT